jgi:hypothetical protein
MSKIDDETRRPVGQSPNIRSQICGLVALCCDGTGTEAARQQVCRSQDPAGHLAEHNRTKREHAAVRRDRYYTSTTHREDPMAM